MEKEKKGGKGKENSFKINYLQKKNCSKGHRVKIHKITPVQGKERGDVEIRDYVVLQKPRDGTDCLPPPRTLILDFTMT